MKHTDKDHERIAAAIHGMIEVMLEIHGEPINLSQEMHLTTEQLGFMAECCSNLLLNLFIWSGAGFPLVQEVLADIQRRYTELSTGIENEKTHSFDFNGAAQRFERTKK